MIKVIYAGIISKNLRYNNFSFNFQFIFDHKMEPEKRRVSGRVRVEPIRLEPDLKTRIFLGNPAWTRPENLKLLGLPDSKLTWKPDIRIS